MNTPYGDLSRLPSRIQEAWTRFEVAWKEGRAPVIEDYLTGFIEPERERLFYELLLCELDRRLGLGEQPELSEYHARFPEYPTPIAAAFRKFQPSANPQNGDPKSPIVGDMVGYFGDYELLKVIGEGGRGIVYEARQISLDRRVALKLIRSASLAGEDAITRFHLEAEATAKLEHPGIVPVYEIGQHEGRHFLTLKLVEGGSLKELKEQGVEFLDDPRACALLIKKVAEAIAYAHARGILHRDLKPANVLLDNKGEPSVTDFGLAKRVNDNSELTQSGVIIGTPAYMAPEQASGHRDEVTTLSDIFGLGATLYFLLTGQAPFGGKSITETLIRVQESTPSPPSKINPKVPRDLETICLKAMAKEPARRYATAGELANDLERYLNDEPIRARPVSVFERGWRWCRRNRAITAISFVVFALLVGIVTATVFLHRVSKEADRVTQSNNKLSHLNKDLQKRADQTLQQLLEESEGLNEDPDRLISLYSKAIEQNPKTARAYRLRSSAYGQKGENDLAKNDLISEIHIDPLAIMKDLWKSQASREKMTPSEKKQYWNKYYERIKESMPDSAITFYDSARWYAREGEHDKAISDYTKAIQLGLGNSLQADAYRARGSVWLNEKNEPDKAIADFSACIRLMPEEPIVYILRSNARLTKQQYTKAIADLSDAIRIAPGEALAYGSRGRIRATCPDPKYRDGKLAVEDAIQACVLSEWKDIFMIETLAAAYAELGDFEKAVEYQQKAQQLNKDDDWIKVGKEILELYKGNKPYREPTS